MGTNYYYRAKPPCDACCRPFEEKHIGKSSAGWAFTLRVYPGEIDSLDDWEALFRVPGSEIQDEYDRPISVDEMMDIIQNRKGYANMTPSLDTRYSFFDKELRLMRVRENPEYCRHGKTCDLFHTDFS